MKVVILLLLFAAGAFLLAGSLGACRRAGLRAGIRQVGQALALVFVAVLGLAVPLWLTLLLVVGWVAYAFRGSLVDRFGRVRIQSAGMSARAHRIARSLAARRRAGDLFAQCGLESVSHDRRGERLRTVPRVEVLRGDPLGVEALASVPEGMTPDEFRAASGRLAHALGVGEVRVSTFEPGIVSLLLVTEEPLNGVRETRRAKAPVRSGLSPMGDTATPVTDPVPCVRLGRFEDGSDWTWDPGAQVFHGAIQGATRSGKSALTYSLLSQLVQSRAVAIAGVDPSAVLLGPIEDAKASRSSWISASSDPAAAAVVIESLVAELGARLSQLRVEGVDKLETFTPERPLVVVVLDEYPGLVASCKAADAAASPRGKTAATVSAGVGRLVREGAKGGFRVVMLAQRMSSFAVDTDDRSNFGLRATLRVDTGDAIRMLHDGVDTSMAEEIRSWEAGRCMVEMPPDGLRIAQSDLCSYADYKAAVAAVGEQVVAGE